MPSHEIAKGQRGTLATAIRPGIDDADLCGFGRIDTVKPDSGARHVDRIAINDTRISHDDACRMSAHAGSRPERMPHDQHSGDRHKSRKSDGPCTMRDCGTATVVDHLMPIGVSRALAFRARTSPRKALLVP
jgi:hypothetical protein